MKKYRIELLKEINVPNDINYLISPIGRFAREINKKKWLEADEGSVGHQLMKDFASSFPGHLKECIEEIDINSIWQKELAIQELISNAILNNSLKRRKAEIRNEIEGI